MKRLNGVAAVAVLFASGSAFAAAPDLQATQSVTINASADRVWAAVKDFDGLSNWHPAAATDKLVSGKNGMVGAERLITLGDGGTIHEKLLDYSDDKRSFKYAIIKGVLPVSDYTSTFVVSEAGAEMAKVTWSGSFKRKDTGDAPAANENDETATTTINSVYSGGLENLKKTLEAK